MTKELCSRISQLDHMAIRFLLSPEALSPDCQDPLACELNKLDLGDILLVKAKDLPRVKAALFPPYNWGRKLFWIKYLQQVVCSGECINTVIANAF